MTTPDQLITMCLVGSIQGMNDICMDGKLRLTSTKVKSDSKLNRDYELKLR